MQLLLDTHALLWWLSGDDALSATARTAIANEDNGIFISAASIWEIATKHRIGKLPGIAAIIADLDQVIADRRWRRAGATGCSWNPRIAMRPFRSRGFSRQCQRRRMKIVPAAIS